MGVVWWMPEWWGPGQPTVILIVQVFVVVVEQQRWLLRDLVEHLRATRSSNRGSNNSHLSKKNCQ
jgi:hypothetical protein